MDNKKPDQQEEKKRVKAAESETKAAEKPEGRIEQGYFSYPDVAAAEAAVAAAPVAKTVEPIQEPVKGPVAPGTAGELKLYDTDPRDAAMIMAIVADATGSKLNELRFKSIKEVK